MKTMTRIGLRTYLEITHVGMVSEAEAGQTVYILVRVRNNHTEAVYATVKFVVNGFEKQGAVSTLQAGGEYSWPLMSFVMPSKSVQGTMAIFYWSADGWIMDDEQTFSVALVGAPPPEPEWEFLDSLEFTIEPGVTPAEWELLARQEFTISPGIPTPPPPPPTEGIPTWMMVAGAVGGAAAVGAAIYFRKKKKKT